MKGVVSLIKKFSGGEASTVGTTNAQGEVKLTITKAGDYTVILTGAPPAPSAFGAPLKNTDVKLGKDPCGCAAPKLVGSANKRGEFILKNTAKGSYTIIVQQADKAITTTKPAQN